MAAISRMGRAAIKKRSLQGSFSYGAKIGARSGICRRFFQSICKPFLHRREMTASSGQGAHAPVRERLLGRHYCQPKRCVYNAFMACVKSI